MIRKDHVPTKARARVSPANALWQKSTGNCVRIGKALRPSQPHPCAAGAGDQFKLGAAARGAAFHVAQAARGRSSIRRRAVRTERKSLAVILDADAAMLDARIILDGFDADSDAFGIGMLDRI